MCSLHNYLALMHGFLKLLLFETSEEAESTYEAPKSIYNTCFHKLKNNQLIKKDSRVELLSSARSTLRILAIIDVNSNLWTIMAKGSN